MSVWPLRRARAVRRRNAWGRVPPVMERGPSPAWLSSPVRPRSPSPRCNSRRRRAGARHDRSTSGRARLQPVHHLVLRPEILLQVLHPFEIADDHAARVAQDVGDDEDSSLRSASTRSAFGRGRAVRAFGDDPAAQPPRDVRVDHPLDRAGREHVAGLLRSARASIAASFDQPASKPSSPHVRTAPRVEALGS